MESSFCLQDFNFDDLVDDLFDASQDCLQDLELEGHSFPATDDRNKQCQEVVPDMPLSITSSSKYGDAYNSSLHEIMGLLNCSSESEYSGLRLIHLLLACAEALSKKAYDLVEILICRLRELVSPTGSVVERVVFYLCNSLINHHVGHMEVDDLDMGLKCPSRSVSGEHLVGAFSLLHQGYPYSRIAHFTANQSIMEAICSGTAHKGRKIKVHIIDFDIMDGIQWPPLMEALNHSNIAVGHMRITAIKWDHGDDELHSYWKHSGRRLSEHAESMGITFSFEEKELKDVISVCIKKEEMVIANCMWRLPYMSHDRSKQKVSDFFHGVRRLRPAILTAGMGAVHCESTSPDVFSRFVQGLQYSCAMFDSMEAELAEHPLARETVEKLLIGPAIMHSTLLRQQDYIISGESKAADIPLVQSGYNAGVISERNVMQARAIISRQAGKYYGAQVRQDGGLCLTWASIPLLSVYVWNTPA